eukprot:g5502.t1
MNLHVYRRFASNMRLHRIIAVLAIAVLGGVLANTSLAPSLLFGDNMVLQQSYQRSAVVFGEAKPGAAVSLVDSSRFHGGTHNTTADATTGRWEISLPPYVVRVGDDNRFTLTLSSGGETRVATNASFGTVILCSGQSNMALNLYPVYDSDAIIAASHHPEMRLFHIPTTAALVPGRTLPAGSAWLQTTPETVPTFSAVCYLTALELERLAAAAEVPSSGRARTYGLVLAALGSTDIQSWMSEGARADALASCWQPRGAASLPASNSHAPAGGEGAGELWNAMVAPLVPLTVGAILWDQGENNAHYCSRAQYACLFRSLVVDWRRAFGGGGGGDGDGTAATPPVPVAASDTLPAAAGAFGNHSGGGAIPHTALAPTYDLGSPQPGSADNHSHWIHCRNKSEVGRRLGRALRPLLSAADGGRGGGGSGSGSGSGPTVVAAGVVLDPLTHRPAVKLSLAHADGLMLRPAQGCFKYCCRQAAPASAGAGARRAPAASWADPASWADWAVFSVANRRGGWLPATGSVDAAGALMVTPVCNVTGAWVSAVRYAALDIPECALYNADMLPALPFELPVPWPPAGERPAVHVA